MRREVWVVKFVVRRLADIEFHETVSYYASRKPGLGKRFEKAVRRVFSEIRRQPNRFAEVQDGDRVAPVPGFPYYAIYYQVQPAQVAVIAVFHTSRDPDSWQRRVI